MEIQQVAEESYNQAKMVLDLMRQELLYLRTAMPKQLAEQATKLSGNYNRLDAEHKATKKKLQGEMELLRASKEQLEEEAKRLEAGAG